MLTMLTMVMPMVHEDMHQRAGGEQCIGQPTCKMGAMFRDQIVGRDGADDTQGNACRRLPERGCGITVLGVFVMFAVHNHRMLATSEPSTGRPRCAGISTSVF